MGPYICLTCGKERDGDEDRRQRNICETCEEGEEDDPETTARDHHTRPP